MTKSKLVSLFVLASLVGALLFVVPATNAAACAQFHPVQRGDNLFRLALRYGTTVAALQQVNGMAAETRIYVGQQLCIRLDGGSNNNGGTRYIIQPGDTLGRIARQYGVDLWVLARVNSIVNPNLIYTGQAITIPNVTIQ